MGSGRWQLTEDGSWSWFDETVGELQHNRAGAYSEAQAQYVQPLLSLHPANKSGWRILDACFGLGYNTWTFLQEVICRPNSGRPVNIEIWAVELDPAILARSLAVLEQAYFEGLRSKLGDSGFRASAHKIYYQTQHLHVQWIGAGVSGNWLETLQQAFAHPACTAVQWMCEGDWGQLTCHWVIGDLAETCRNWTAGTVDTPPALLDAVFHDAFSWKKLPDLWTAELFCFYRPWLLPRGVLLTYSRASIVKQALEQSGYRLKTTQALGGKRGGLMGYVY